MDELIRFLLAIEDSRLGVILVTGLPLFLAYLVFQFSRTTNKTIKVIETINKSLEKVTDKIQQSATNEMDKIKLLFDLSKSETNQSRQELAKGIADGLQGAVKSIIFSLETLNRDNTSSIIKEFSRGLNEVVEVMTLGSQLQKLFIENVEAIKKELQGLKQADDISQLGVKIEQLTDKINQLEKTIKEQENGNTSDRSSSFVSHHTLVNPPAKD